MGIKIITAGEEFEITPENVSETRPRLEALLVPETPVMVEHHEFRGHGGFGGGLRVRRHLLFAKKADKKLVPRVGLRGSAYAVAGGRENEFAQYQLVRCWAENQEATELEMPWSGTQEQHGCSDRGGSSWVSFHSGGTERILLGAITEEKYADALNAIKFVEGGYKFQLPSFYAMPGYCVSEAGLSREENDAKHNSAANLVALTAAMDLLKVAARETDIRNTELAAYQFSDGARNLASSRGRGYPVVAGDFFIRELMHPSRLVGFVKVGKGVQYGDTFLYPAKGAEELFETALSDKIVKRCYPMGFQKASSEN